MPKFTASLLPRGGRPALPLEAKGAGSQNRPPPLHGSSFRFHESEPRSGMSGEALPASQRQPLASRQHSSDERGGLAGLLLRTELLLWDSLVTRAWQPLFNNLENVYSSAGRLHPWIQKHSALGLPAVESEIPLVTVTEDAGLLLEGLWSLVFTRSTLEERRPAAGAPGAGVGGPAGLLGSLPLLKRGSSFPLCLLPAWR